MRGLERILGKLPPKMRLELDNIMKRRGGVMPSEIRLRIGRCSSVLFLGERVNLLSSLNSEDIARMVDVLTEGAFYAHQSTLLSGYMTIDGGVRVGISARASYNGEELVGISEVSSLVFRIPSQKCEVGEELYRAFCNTVSGMLIYSPPGIGKTSALRELVRIIGSGKDGENVVVVDERLEFIPEDYEKSSVDILRGYKKTDGMEIALRTLSPDVIAVDEIGSLREAELMRAFTSGGVRIIATAHADSLSGLFLRRNIEPFISSGVFDTFVGLSSLGGKRRIFVTKGDGMRAAERLEFISDCENMETETVIAASQSVKSL